MLAKVSIKQLTKYTIYCIFLNKQKTTELLRFNNEIFVYYLRKLISNSHI